MNPNLKTMKKLLLIGLALLASAGTMMAQEEAHRYGIKSGIAHEVTRLNEHETPAVHYFDNYGDCEAVVQTIDMGGLGSFENTTIVKKEKAWFLNASGMTEFDNPLPDLTFINPSEAVVAKYKLVDTGEEEEVLGRICRKYTYETTQGRKKVQNTAWVYKGITLKSIMKIGRRETYYEMTDFQENAEVPAEIFNIPE